MRLADGALSYGYAVVIVDCKGSGLGDPPRRVASRHGISFTIVDPRDPTTIGYDPCTGNPASVANKIIGAFTFGRESEIYKQISMEVLPVICRALTAAGDEVTLDSIYDSLSKGSLSRLGRWAGVEQLRNRLEVLEESGGIGTAGYVGLQKRLGACRGPG